MITKTVTQSINLSVWRITKLLSQVSEDLDLELLLYVSSGPPLAKKFFAPTLSPNEKSWSQIWAIGAKVGAKVGAKIKPQYRGNFSHVFVRNSKNCFHMARLHVFMVQFKCNYRCHWSAIIFKQNMNSCTTWFVLVKESFIN